MTWAANWPGVATPLPAATGHWLGPRKDAPQPKPPGCFRDPIHAARIAETEALIGDQPQAASAMRINRRMILLIVLP